MKKTATAEDRQALMQLIEIDFDSRSKTQDEFNDQMDMRRTVITSLLRADQPLLNEIGVAATVQRRGWIHRIDLMQSVQKWLREQTKV